MCRDILAVLTSTAGRFVIGVLCLGALLQNVASTQAGRTVLTSRDFQYLGMMRVPPEISPFGWGGLTFRKVNGQLRFFLLGSRSISDPVIEISAPGFGPTLASAPRAAVVRNWGTPYRRTGVPVAEIYWTEDLEWFNGLLYWVYGNYYNVTLVHDPSIGVSDLSATPVGVYGPWRTAEHSQRTRGYVTTIPTWYANAYLNGRRFAVGSGLRSGNIGSSWGPMLAAIPAPTPTTPTGPQLSSVVLVKHPLTSGASRDYRMTREPNYIATADPDLPPSGGTGYWTQVDYIQSAVWIDLPDKHGVVFFGALGTGRVWYGGSPEAALGGLTDPCGNWQGEHAQTRAQRWWIYDPMAFVPVIQGNTNSWDLRPTDTFDPNVAIASGRMSVGDCKPPTGAAFDEETGTLYLVTVETDPEPFGVTGWLPVIHAFRVGAGSGPPTPGAPAPPTNVRVIR